MKSGRRGIKTAPVGPREVPPIHTDESAFVMPPAAHHLVRIPVTACRVLPGFFSEVCQGSPTAMEG